LKTRALTLALGALLLAACGDPEPEKKKEDAFFSAPPSARPSPAHSGAPAAPSDGATGPASGGAPGLAAAASASATSTLPPLPAQEFTEADFAETDKSRDPFRTFSKTFIAQAKGRVTVQRVVMAERFALDELKTVGIVSRGDIKAMMTDPTGLGWIIKTGDYVGKAEVVHTGGPTGSDVAINWRVDRIRENDIVFVREDPSHPEIPPSTRVIVLYPSDQLPGSPGGPPPVTRP
jgi:type IV pilus assembly protein PilP